MNEPICPHCGGGPADTQHQRECEEDTVLYQQQARIADLERRLAEVRKDASAALEIAANDLEAVYAEEQEGWLPSEGEKSPWEMARLAADTILKKNE